MSQQEHDVHAATPKPIRAARRSGRTVPRVGAVLREVPDAPRMISHENGQVMSGQAMARARAQGIADHAYRSARLEYAMKRYIAAIARQVIEAHAITHPDDLYVKVDQHLRASTVLKKRGSQFWVRKWDG